MRDRPLLRRRTAVTGTLGGLAAAVMAGGCDADDLRPPEDDAEPTPTTAPDRPTPDQVLVDGVLADLVAAVGALTSARTFRPLRRALGPLSRAHSAHLEVLEGSEGDARTPTRVPPTADAALAAVHRSERRLQRRLVDAASRAESGALARLLASMSASVTQHLAVLPTSLPAGPPQ